MGRVSSCDEADTQRESQANLQLFHELPLESLTSQQAASLIELAARNSNWYDAAAFCAFPPAQLVRTRNATPVDPCDECIGSCIYLWDAQALLTGLLALPSVLQFSPTEVQDLLADSFCSGKLSVVVLLARAAKKLQVPFPAYRLVHGQLVRLAQNGLVHPYNYEGVELLLSTPTGQSLAAQDLACLLSATISVNWLH